MSFVEARDYALWVDHIHGNRALQDRIRAMEPGELIELEVDGFRGRWEKLPPGGPHAGLQKIKASGEAQRRWHALRDERRGGIASIRMCD
ncbi:MAG: hypothetical protein ACE5G3_13510 [Gammaproteobacteria bacterium]